jgi:hypothetical protein
MRAVDARPNFLIFDLFNEKYAFRSLYVLFQYLDLILGALAYGAEFTQLGAIAYSAEC